MKKSFSNKTDSSPVLGKYVPNLGIDEAIASLKIKYENAPNENWKEYYEKQIDNLLFEKEYTIKTTKSIIKAAIKGTIKDIRLCYPALLNWKEESRSFQLRTKRRPFSENMINEFGKTVQSISVTCKDGIVRIFDVKIEAFWGRGRRRATRSKACVNVYFTLRDPSKKDNPISVEYGAN